MSELTPEELALLATEETPKARRGRPRKQVDDAAEAPADTTDAAETPAVQPATGSVPRGPITPVQYGDDGWGDLPVQMRG